MKVSQGKFLSLDTGSAKTLGTMTPIMATANIAKINTGFNTIFKNIWYLGDYF
jgi:hypothetical protein